MKNLILALSVLAVCASCGKSSNKVNSGNVSETTALVPAALVNFEGNYDLIDMRTEDCGAALTITRVCNGYRLESNNRMGAEDFCNINAEGETERNPPNPDRNPPNPDRNPPNPDRSVPVVTQNGNVLKSVVKISSNISFTNTLTLNTDGVLVKVSDLKSRTSRCMYQKR